MTLTASIANILASGRPTYFAYEAACRYGIRSSLCLDGYRWPDADATADDVVASALRQIGARRPRWDEGQPEFTATGTERCVHCRRAMPDGVGDGHDPRKFCSGLCRKAWHNSRYAEDHRAEAKAATQAWRDARRAAAPEKPCAQCGRLFRPLKEANRPEPRFCGKSCAASFGNSHRRRAHEKSQDLRVSRPVRQSRRDFIF
jgi:hypothetical protein